MAEDLETGPLAGLEAVPIVSRRAIPKIKWVLPGLAVGLIAGAWIAGGPDR